MSKTGIFFDFDGTLFYGTTDINYHTINLALKDMGRPPITREQANSTVGDKLWDACRRLLDTQDDALCNQLLQGIIDHSPEAINRYAVIEPDCVHMLQTLSQKVPLAICSNAEPGYLLALTEKFGIRPYFSHIWHRKPNYDKKSAIPQLKQLLGVDRTSPPERPTAVSPWRCRTILVPGTPWVPTTTYTHTRNWNRCCSSSSHSNGKRSD